MTKLKEALLSFDGVIDNEYLDQYIALVSNSFSFLETDYTESHHVIPASFYKSFRDKDMTEAVFRNKIVDEDPKNSKVELLFKDHCKAHWLLFNCTSGYLKSANALAFINMTGSKTKLQTGLTDIEYDELQQQIEIVRSEGQFRGNPGFKYSEEMKAAMSKLKTGYRWCHKGDSYTTIPDDAPIPEGYVLGKPPVTETTKIKIAETIKSKQLKAYKNVTEKRTIYLGPNDSIPEGFVPGKYIDPEVEKIWREKLRQASLGQTHVCPDYVKELNRQAQLGTKCYTDGKRTIKLKPGESIPDGFYPGVFMTEVRKAAAKQAGLQNRGRKTSEEAKEKNRQAHLGKIPVNAKRVFCRETGKEYLSISKASLDTTVPSSYIQKALKSNSFIEVIYKNKIYHFEPR